ncbi:repetin, partial [Biomphalaria glabrata]
SSGSDRKRRIPSKSKPKESDKVEKEFGYLIELESESASESTASLSDDDMAGIKEIAEAVIVETAPGNSFDVYYERILGDVTKKSAAKQFFIGSAAGCVTGFLVQKVSKAAAAGLAGTLLLILVAQHNGIVSINWTKLDREITKARAKAREALSRHKTSIFDRSHLFYEENYFLGIGFVSGFLFDLLV